jgi:protoporphyrinogen oxidase
MDANGVVILGGGLAGLAAALYSGAPVYEAAPDVGGVAASDQVEGFTFDRGIHILQTRNPTVLALLDELGVRLIDHSRQAYVYSHGVYTAYPFQVNTAGLPMGLRVRCVRDFLRRHRHPEPLTYEHWIYRSVGSSFARAFLIPYSEKFWTIAPSEMTCEWTAGRVPQPTVAQVLRGAVHSRQTKIGTNIDFRYPVMGAGYGAIARAMVPRVRKVHVNHRAMRIDVGRRLVSFENGASAHYESLISSVPLPALVRLCPAAPPAVRAAAALLRTNSILTVNLGLEGPTPTDKHWVHFPEREVSFFRISYPHTFAPDVSPPGMAAISAEVSFAPERPPDRATIADRVVDDLVRVRALDRVDRIRVRHVNVIPYAYCIYDIHRRAAVRTVHQWLKSVGIVPCGRYGLWTYFWSDEAMLSGKKAAELVRRRRARTVNVLGEAVGS